jgi:hypothetical protein
MSGFATSRSGPRSSLVSRKNNERQNFNDWRNSLFTAALQTTNSLSEAKNMVKDLIVSNQSRPVTAIGGRTTPHKLAS